MTVARASAVTAHPVQGGLPWEEMPPPNRQTRRGLASSTVSHLVLGLFGVLFILPLIWVVFASVDGHASWAVEWPHWSLDNFRAALGGPYLQSLVNSLILGFVSTAISTVCATLAAYPLSRRHVPFKGPLLLGVVFLSGVPLAILIIPVYEMYAEIGWLSILPTAIFLGVTSLPFEIYLIKNFFDSVPEELEEAARVERAGTWQVLTRVVGPLALPGIGAAAIFGFINSWGAFIVPLVLISSVNQQPAPVAMYGFFTSFVVHYGDIGAFSLVFSLPVIILYALASRLFRGGFVLGGAIRG
jgi:multiple sugar transport system permease protein